MNASSGPAAAGADARGELVDWLVIDPHGAQGGFTIHALKEIHGAG